MAWKTETKSLKGIQEVYGFSDKDTKVKKLIFRFLISVEKIECFPQSRWFPLEKIILEGFTNIPEEFNNRALLKTKSALNSIQRILKSLDVREFIISADKDTALEKLTDGIRLILKYSDLRSFIKVMKAANSTAQADLRAASDGFFKNSFPSAFKAKESSQKTRLARLISSLDESIIPEMNGEEIDGLISFTSAVVQKRYVKQETRSQLTSSAKLEFENIALSQVIAEFENLLSSTHTESTWSEFLKRILFLVETRYVHVFERLNVITGTSREVDFGLVDTHGFLDIFEIKTPEAKLLSSTDDRGNHYWHSDTVKAITQAEKYLYNAEQRGPSLEKDIRRELNTNVRVSRPRTLLITGKTEQLNTDNKSEDFRVMRHSLKNIEIVLYDELLQRLKNQQERLSDLQAKKMR